MVNKMTQTVLGAIALIFMLWLVVPPAPAQISASGASECTFHNAARESQPSESQSSESQPSDPSQSGTEPETVIILGKIPHAPYVVVVLKKDDVTLDTVRQCVSDAFQTRSQLGSYIRAGAFSRRSSAEALSHYLRTLNLDTRVIYLP